MLIRLLELTGNLDAVNVVAAQRAGLRRRRRRGLLARIAQPVAPTQKGRTRRPPISASGAGSVGAMTGPPCGPVDQQHLGQARLVERLQHRRAQPDQSQSQPARCPTRYWVRAIRSNNRPSQPATRDRSTSNNRAPASSTCPTDVAACRAPDRRAARHRSRATCSTSIVTGALVVTGAWMATGGFCDIRTHPRRVTVR